MQVARNLAWRAVFIPVLLIGSAAAAQTKGAWIDPPADLSSEPPGRDLPLRSGLPTPPPQAAAPHLRPALPPSSDGPSLADIPESTSSIRSTRQDHVAQPQTSPGRQQALPASPPDARQASRAAGGLTPREQEARHLAIHYLDLWSAPNHVALQATPSFYGPGVTFHGRSISFRALLDEKRRFARRWPDRTYRYRSGTMGVTCASDNRSCTVRSLFDFTAADARLGRRSRGVGSHELVVSFAGEHPVITSENSRVLSRER